MSASPLAGNRFHSREARNSVLREAGIHPLTAVDLGRFAAPEVTSAYFGKIFGGSPSHERPRCNKEWNIVCINRNGQPYAPHSVGESGLVFIFPDGIARCEDTSETFHLFLNMDPKLSKNTRRIRYLGTYTKVPIVHATVEPQEWRDLPSIVSGIFSPARSVRLFFLMAHCRLVGPGHIVFALQEDLVCVKHMQGFPYANRVGVANRQQMPFASGLNKTQRSRAGSPKVTLKLHFVLVKKWVSGIYLPPLTKIIFIPENGI